MIANTSLIKRIKIFFDKLCLKSSLLSQTILIIFNLIKLFPARERKFMKKDFKKLVINLLIFVTTIEVLFNFNGILISGGELTNNPANVILQKESKSTYTITEKYEVDGGIIISNNTISTLYTGDNYTKQAPNILDFQIYYVVVDGVRYDTDIAQINNVNSNHEVTFVYKNQDPPIQYYTIRESYSINENPRYIWILSGVKNYYIYTGLKYNFAVEAPYKPDYIAIDVQIDGVYQGTTTAVIDNVNSSHNIVFIYKRADKYTITEKYILLDGTDWNVSDGVALMPDKITSIDVGSRYIVSPPRYIGGNNDYIFSLASLDGGDYKSIYPLNYEDYVDFVNRDMINIRSDHTIIYVYSTNDGTENITNTTSINTTVTYPVQYTITEKYQSVDGINFVNDTISNINAGDNYIKQAPNLQNGPIINIYIDGHSYGPDAAQIQNVNSDHEVIFVYDFNYAEQEYYTINEKYFDDSNQRYMDTYGWSADAPYPADISTKFNGFDHNVFSGYNFTKKAINIPINETIDSFKYQAVDVMIDGVLQGTTTAVIDNVNSNHDIVYIYRLVRNQNS